MKRIAAALMLAPLATLAPANLAQSQESQQQDLQRVNSYIRALTTMQANFSQTDRSGQVLTGTVTMKQPGRIRFQYQKGVPMLIVSNGSSLTVIDYEVRQVQRWPIRNSPLGVLLDPKRDLASYGKVIPTGDSRILSVEVRDPKRPEYGVITLVFQRKPSAPAGLDLHGWVALDAQNNRTTIRLSNIRYGVDVPDSTFRWRDPRTPGPRG